MARTRQLILTSAAIATALALGACGTGEGDGGTTEGDGEAAGGEIVIGSANFPESEIIASIYSAALEDAGYDVTENFNIGSREVYLAAVQEGSVDLVPDYTGNLLYYLDGEATAASSEDIAAALPPVLEEAGLVGYEQAPAEDKDSITVTAETAEEWGLTTIGDLAAYNDELKLAAAPEFAERTYGLSGLEEKYGVIPTEFVPIADGGGPATIGALLDGTVQAADIYTTTPAIANENLVVLEDPENNFTAQNVIPVINADAAAPEIEEVLNAISAELTTEDLIALNERVSGDEKAEPSTAAQEWLEEKGLLG
jgi:osmoprotectant transport system substrate-binding protein